MPHVASIYLCHVPSPRITTGWISLEKHVSDHLIWSLADKRVTILESGLSGSFKNSQKPLAASSQLVLRYPMAFSRSPGQQPSWGTSATVACTCRKYSWACPQIPRLTLYTKSQPLALTEHRCVGKVKSGIRPRPGGWSWGWVLALLVLQLQEESHENQKWHLSVSLFFSFSPDYPLRGRELHITKAAFRALIRRSDWKSRKTLQLSFKLSRAGIRTQLWEASSMQKSSSIMNGSWHHLSWDLQGGSLESSRVGCGLLLVFIRGEKPLLWFLAQITWEYFSKDSSFWIWHLS